MTYNFKLSSASRLGILLRHLESHHVKMTSRNIAEDLVEPVFKPVTPK